MFTTAISEIRHRKSAPLIRHGSDVNVSGENNPSAFRAYQSCGGLVCRTKRRLDPTPLKQFRRQSAAEFIACAMCTDKLDLDGRDKPLGAILFNEGNAIPARGDALMRATSKDALLVMLCGLLAIETDRIRSRRSRMQTDTSNRSTSIRQRSRGGRSDIH